MTQISYSASVFPRSKPARALLYVADNHEVEKLIRDAKDQSILNAAIVSDVDIILIGDKDFLSLEIEYPKCMMVAQFLKMRA